MNHSILLLAFAYTLCYAQKALIVQQNVSTIGVYVQTVKLGLALAKGSNRCFVLPDFPCFDIAAFDFFRFSDGRGTCNGRILFDESTITKRYALCEQGFQPDPVGFYNATESSIHHLYEAVERFDPFNTLIVNLQNFDPKNIDNEKVVNAAVVSCFHPSLKPFVETTGFQWPVHDDCSPVKPPAKDLHACPWTGDFVIGTGANSRYWDRLLNLIGSLHFWEPNLKIVAFDLGLEQEQRDFLKTSVRNVQYRAFPLDSAYLQHLSSYQFKAVVVRTLFLEYGKQLYGCLMFRVITVACHAMFLA